MTVGHKKKPLIIAHRGAKREAPENTIPAFERAIELGADGIEFDVLLTGDGIPVVTHNDNLSILTGFKGYAHSTPIHDVQKLDAGSHFDKSFAGTRIPTFESVLDLLHRHEILTIIEIKGQMGFFSMAAHVIGQIVEKIKFKGPLLVSSSNIHILHELSRHYPKLPRAAIIAHPAFSFFIPDAYAKIGAVSAIHPSIETLSGGFVRRTRRLNCALHPWTVNDASDVDKCITLGVDGIITDDVVFVREYIEITPPL